MPLLRVTLLSLVCVGVVPLKLLLLVPVNVRFITEVPGRKSKEPLLVMLPLVLNVCVAAPPDTAKVAPEDIDKSPDKVKLDNAVLLVFVKTLNVPLEIVTLLSVKLRVVAVVALVCKVPLPDLVNVL